MAYEVVVPKHHDSLAARTNLEAIVSKNLLRYIYRLGIFNFVFCFYSTNQIRCLI